MNTPSKGAKRMADVSGPRRKALTAGTEQTQPLVEAFVIDMASLFASVYPDLAQPAKAHIKQSASFTQRMTAAGELALQHKGRGAFGTLASHASDTVRGWAAYLLGAQPDLFIAQRLARIRGLADDPHFGVREWAWIAIRPALLTEIKTAIETLQPWTEEKSPNLRRYAVEIMRPRGVWCSHSPELKTNPEPGRVLLEPLKADPARYVQDSVANWLNDAAKTNPQWVTELCATWLAQSRSPTTEYICKRATRSLRKKTRRDNVANPR